VLDVKQTVRIVAADVAAGRIADLAIFRRLRSFRRLLKSVVLRCGDAMPNETFLRLSAA
jgi:hypothetical protein